MLWHGFTQRALRDKERKGYMIVVVMKIETLGINIFKFFASIAKNYYLCN